MFSFIKNNDLSGFWISVFCVLVSREYSTPVGNIEKRTKIRYWFQGSSDMKVFPCVNVRIAKTFLLKRNLNIIRNWSVFSTPDVFK